MTVLEVIQSAQLRRSTESVLQSDLCESLRAAGHNVNAEVVLSPTDRIDFLVDGIGIECKLKWSRSKVAAQLMRYADSPRIKALILVTTSAILARGWPDRINDKPFAVHLVRGLQ